MTCRAPEIEAIAENASKKASEEKERERRLAQEKRYREKMYAEKQQAEKERALAHARHRLAQGDNPDDVVHHLANRLTRRLIHQPTLGLRDAARSGDPDTLRVGQEVLGLQVNDSEGDG